MSGTLDTMVLQWLRWLEQFDEWYDDLCEAIMSFLFIAVGIVGIGLALGWLVSVASDSNGVLDVAWTAAGVWLVLLVFLVVLPRWGLRLLLLYARLINWL